MIHLTPDTIREHAEAQIEKYRCPRCLQVTVAPDRILTFSHPKYDVIVGIGNIPEFAPPEVLDEAIKEALCALTVQLAHEMSTQVWNTRPPWIDTLAMTPGGRSLAEKWLRDRAAQIGQELIDTEVDP
jgi:hypothetical protein